MSGTIFGCIDAIKRIDTITIYNILLTLLNITYIKLLPMGLLRTYYEKCYTSHPVGAMLSLCIQEYLQIKLLVLYCLPFALVSNLCYS